MQTEPRYPCNLNPATHLLVRLVVRGGLRRGSRPSLAQSGDGRPGAIRGALDGSRWAQRAPLAGAPMRRWLSSLMRSISLSIFSCASWRRRL
jgi:hypothetical protein